MSIMYEENAYTESMKYTHYMESKMIDDILGISKN